MNNSRMKVFSALAIMALLVMALPVTEQASAQDEVEVLGEYVSGELIVGINTDTKDETLKSQGINALSAQIGAQVADAAMDQSSFLFRFNSDEEAEQAIEYLQQQPWVSFVERNQVSTVAESLPSGEEATPLYNPSDPKRFLEWQLNKIMYYQAPGPVSTNVPCIVVIDTGVDYNHGDLKGKVYRGKDFIDNDLFPMDANGRGTHMAGIAAAKTNNAVGIAGISPLSKILAIRVANASGTGTAWKVSQGIQWANSAGASKCGGQVPKIYVLGISFAKPSTAITNQVNAAANKGRLVIAAAGDNNKSVKAWPGAEPKAFGVAATEENDRRSWFSNFDTKTAPWVDIAAPGYSIYSTINNRKYDLMDGTAMSAAVVAGTAARVWSKNPTFTLAQLRAKLQNTGDPAGGFPRVIKRVNLYRALGGTKTTLQGRIFNGPASEPLLGAKVVVKNVATGKVVCSITTKANGYYTCLVPKSTKFKVSVSKTGYRNQAKTVYLGTKSKLNINLALASNAAGSWEVVVQWQGWQPYQSPGREMDLWLVEPTTPTCYSAWLGNNYNLNVTTGT
ncbi:MAG: S8 family serine peptidase, partial [Chloroflexota bacterium]